MYFPYRSVELVRIAQAIDLSIRADLQNLRDSYFTGLLISSATVLVGVFMEGPELGYEVIGVFKHRSREGEYRTTPVLFRREHHAPGWVTVLALLGWTLIFLGVAGEGIAEGYVARADAVLQRFNDILTSEAHKETAFALERAAANEREAADLRLQVEQEKIAGLKLKEYAAWRIITDKQERTITKHLASLKGHTLEMFVFTDDPETAGFAERLGTVLGKVMKVHLSSYSQLTYIPAPGLTFTVGKDREQDFALIVEALDRAGVDKATALKKTAEHKAPDEGIEINVGGRH